MSGRSISTSLFLSAWVLHSLIVLLVYPLQAPMPVEYETIATNLLEGRGFVFPLMGQTYRSFCNPVYPWLCAGVYALFGHAPLYMLLVHALLMALLCTVVFHIGKRFNTLTGVVAAVLTMAHPGLSYYTALWLHSLSLDALLFGLVILGVIRLKESPSWFRAVSLGLVTAVQFHERVVIGIFILPALIWAYGPHWQGNRRRAVSGGATVVCTVCLLAAPWTIRNLLIHREFVLVMTTTGELLWRGNNPHATGVAFAQDGRPMFLAADPAFQRKILSLDELGQKHAFERAAIDYIRANPWRFLSNTLNKLKIFWWFSPLTGLLYPSRFLKWYVGYYAAMLVLALAGVWRTVRSNVRVDILVLIGMLCALLSLGQSVFYVQAKHRWAIEPFVLLFASVAMVSVRDACCRLVAWRRLPSASKPV